MIFEFNSLFPSINGLILTRETDEEKENNIYWEMYINAINEFLKGKINPNDENGSDEIDGAVFNDEL